MFDIVLSGTESGPLYMQLYYHIRRLIENNNIKDGTKLPSIRSLIQQTAFSKTTIETAYHMLLEEGYVLSKPRSGLYVVNPKPPQASEHIIDELVKQETVQQSNGSHTPAPSIQKELIDFSLLAVDDRSFPVQAWRSVLNETLLNKGSLLHQYGDPRGEYDLRQNLAHYLRTSRGVACLPEQIIIGTGISYSIQILKMLLERPSKIAYEESGFAQVGEKFAQHGFDLIPFLLKDNHFPASYLIEANLHTLYVTPSHRSSGHPLSYSIRQQMLHWAYHHDGYIIEDDYDGEFRYSGKTVPALHGLDKQGVVIYIGTFSKAFSPALRMSYTVLPLHLAEKLRNMEHMLSCPSRIDQLAMSLFIQRGHWYRHIGRMRNIYRKKNIALTRLINNHFGDYVQIEGDSAGLHVELTVKTTQSAEKLIELAYASGVRVYGSYNKEPKRKTIGNSKIYLGFGGVNAKEMQRGVELLREAWSPVWL